MNQYVIYVIPLFLLTVIFEIVANAVKHKNVYKFDNTITNFSLGLTQQIFEALTKTIFVVLFLWLYQHSLFKIPNTALSFVLLILACDFLFYWFHRAGHNINFLWAIHGVHHQSVEFNLSLSLRQPLLQKAAMLAFYLVIPLLGFSMEIIASAFAFQTIYPFFLHSSLTGKWGFLEYFMVTPAHHKVHHGVNPVYINKNYGNTFIIWDRMFGTFQAETEPVEFGTSERFTSTDPWLANVFFWKQIAETAKKRKDFFSKLKAYIQGPDALIPGDAEAIQKDKQPMPMIPRRIKQYIVVQYVVLLLVSVFVLYQHTSFTLLFKIVSLAFIFWSTINFSGLMRGKRFAFTWEKIRMVILCLLIYLFVFSHKLGLDGLIYSLNDGQTPYQ